MSDSNQASDKRPEPHRKCPLCGSDSRRLPRSRYSRDGWQLKHCYRCELLFLENPPSLQSLANEHSWLRSCKVENQRRLESRPMLDQSHSLWKRWCSRWLVHRKAAALIRRYVVGGNLLDVGCGTGSLFLRLPEAIVPHGIEIDPDAFELAQSRAEQRGGSVIQADALSGLRVMDSEHMAGILMHSFLEHDVEPLEVLRSAHRVLCHDGVIIIKVHNFDCWNRQRSGKEWPGFCFPNHVNYFTPRTLSQIISKAGLRIRRFAWCDRLPTSDNMWVVAEKVPLVKRQ